MFTGTKSNDTLDLDVEISGSGSHKDVYDLGYKVLKEPKNFSRDEAERDLGKFGTLNQFGLLNTPETWIEERNGSFYIGQEKAQAELTDMAEFYDEEFLFDRALGWMDQAVWNDVLYTDAKPENYSLFGGSIMPHDLTGGEWIEHDFTMDDVQSTYDNMIYNFSNEFDADREELEYIAEVRSPYFNSKHT